LGRGFPQIIMALRRERGLSQKAAAAALGISQALLSHYEKGIRECGLPFLLRAADYYGVSVDYLLGRTQRRGAAQGDSGAGLAAQITDTLGAIFSLSEKYDCEQLGEQARTFFALAAYRFLRILPDREADGLYTVDRAAYHALCCAKMRLVETERVCAASGRTLGGKPDRAGYFPKALAEKSLPELYPAFADSLKTLIEYAERQLSAES
jgi:transcriptional regulator with XRE-family HTH domain